MQIATLLSPAPVPPEGVPAPAEGVSFESQWLQAVQAQQAETAETAVPPEPELEVPVEEVVDDPVVAEVTGEQPQGMPIQEWEAMAWVQHYVPVSVDTAMPEAEVPPVAVVPPQAKVSEADGPPPVVPAPEAEGKVLGAPAQHMPEPGEATEGLSDRPDLQPKVFPVAHRSEPAQETRTFVLPETKTAGTGDIQVNPEADLPADAPVQVSGETEKAAEKNVSTPAIPGGPDNPPPPAAVLPTLVPLAAPIVVAPGVRWVQTAALPLEPLQAVSGLESGDDTTTAAPVGLPLRDGGPTPEAPSAPSALRATAESSDGLAPKPLPARLELVHQMGERIRLLHHQGAQEMRVSLNPAHLGQVEVHLSRHEGQYHLHMIAETPLAKELLESQLGQLKQHLGQQGLLLQQASVDLGGQSEQGRQPTEEQTSASGATGTFKLFPEADDTQEDGAPPVLLVPDSAVNYLA